MFITFVFYVGPNNFYVRLHFSSIKNKQNLFLPDFSNEKHINTLFNLMK